MNEKLYFRSEVSLNWDTGELILVIPKKVKPGEIERIKRAFVPDHTFMTRDGRTALVRKSQ